VVCVIVRLVSVYMIVRVRECVCLCVSLKLLFYKSGDSFVKPAQDKVVVVVEILVLFSKFND